MTADRHIGRTECDSDCLTKDQFGGTEQQKAGSADKTTPLSAGLTTADERHAREGEAKIRSRE